MAGRRTPHTRAVSARTSLPLGKKLAFAAVAVFGVLALLEAAARLFTSVAPNALWSLHSRLVDAVGFRALNEILIPDPDRFWTIRPNVTGRVLAGTVTGSTAMRFVVSTDSDGCRLAPAAGAASDVVAFLGDSTTFGIGTDDADTFPAILQQRLGTVRSVNLGVPGYSSYQGRLRLEAFPFPRTPRAVVVTFGFNDDAQWDNRGDLDYAAQMEAERGRLVHRSRLLSLMAGLLQHRRMSAEEFATPPTNPRPRLQDDEFAGQIGRIVEWCVSRGAVPVLVVWPQRPQLALENQYTSKQLVLLKIGAADPRVKVINLVDLFRARGAESLLLDIVHTNGAGNRVVADALEPILRNAVRR